MTEDLVFLLEAMGLRTGIDLDRLIAARASSRRGCPARRSMGTSRTWAFPRASSSPRTHGGLPDEQRSAAQGIRVVEFSHMVMGPTCGLVLADLGADVVKVEPIGAGDNTRRLAGSGAGYFPTYNRNKRSLAVDLKTRKGLPSSSGWSPRPTS